MACIHVHRWVSVLGRPGVERCRVGWWRVRRHRCGMWRKPGCVGPVEWTPVLVEIPNECGECGAKRESTWEDRGEPAYHLTVRVHPTLEDYVQCVACGKEWLGLAGALKRTYGPAFFAQFREIS